MFFYVNTFISTEDGIAEKLLPFKIKFAVTFKLLITPGDIIILHMDTINEIWSKIDQMFCHSGPFFTFSPH